MIQIENLSKHYGRKCVLDNLSLNVERGSVLGFIGPNGAGKTTAMRMLCGVMPVYSGKITVGGCDIALKPLEARKFIGYLPENAPLPPSMTVRGFLKYAAVMCGVDKTLVRSRIALAVERCALQDVLDQEIESLSKGYKRRTCLAQAIIHEPKVLVMDEPTDGLDPDQKRHVRALINSLRKDTAIIISTHILEEVDSVCDRVALLCKGKKLFDGATNDFLTLGKKLTVMKFNVSQKQMLDAYPVLEREFGSELRLSGRTFYLSFQGGVEQIEQRVTRLKRVSDWANIRFEGEIGAATPSLDDIFAAFTSGILPGDDNLCDVVEPDETVSATAEEQE